MKTKQHRLNATAQIVVATWASLTGKSESATASWLIENAIPAMTDRIAGALAFKELEGLQKLNEARLKGEQLVGRQQLELEKIAARRRKGGDAK